MNTSSQACSLICLMPFIVSLVAAKRESFAVIRPCDKIPILFASHRLIGISDAANSTPAIKAAPNCV